MAYSTQSDLLKGISEEELAELTAESGGTPEATLVAEAVAKADAEIDAMCGVKYQVPFSPVPEMVRSLSVDMAIYHLFTRRNLEDKVRRQKYEDAVKFLDRVSKGTATLGASALPPPEVESAVAEITSSDRVFSRESLKNW
jgi:phage gp36-like protein